MCILHVFILFHITYKDILIIHVDIIIQLNDHLIFHMLWQHMLATMTYVFTFTFNVTLKPRVISPNGALSLYNIQQYIIHYFKVIPYSTFPTIISNIFRSLTSVYSVPFLMCSRTDRNKQNYH